MSVHPVVIERSRNRARHDGVQPMLWAPEPVPVKKDRRRDEPQRGSCIVDSTVRNGVDVSVELCVDFTV